MRTNAKKQKRKIFIRILKSPVTALLKVTNFYMNSMSSCASRFDENTVVNCSIAPQVVSQQPRNFSVSSSKDSKQEDELKDLIFAVSAKLSEAKIELKNVDQFQKPRMGLARAVEKRSYSVGIGKLGRIDEEASCDFREDEYSNVNLYPRL